MLVLVSSEGDVRLLIALTLCRSKPKEVSRKPLKFCWVAIVGSITQDDQEYLVAFVELILDKGGSTVLSWGT